MGVALDRDVVTALDRAFQFTDATQELMVELTFAGECFGFTSERAFNFSKFFRERGDERWLRRANESRLQVLNFIHQAMNKVDDRISALSINPLNVSLAEKIHRLSRNRKLWNGREGKL